MRYKGITILFQNFCAGGGWKKEHFLPDNKELPILLTDFGALTVDLTGDRR